MEPYNIRISYGSHDVTLTILPAEQGYYKVIYYGGILGGVCYDGKDWDIVGPDKIIAGDLPFYEPGLVGERIEIELNDHVVDRIGWEINLHENDDQEF